MTGTTPIDTIIQGDCLEEMKKLPDRSIDAIVTDPPYELTSGNSKKGFMGKAWDGTGIAYNVDMWGECLRVLKPGGHLLAFGGSRTYHRTACAIEDAGFEIRDSIHWVYGSGFPKSLDISKKLDQRGGQSVGWFGPWLRQWREENDITQKEIAALFPSNTGRLTGCVANWELNLNMPTCEQFNLICKVFKLPFKSLEEAEREVVGKGHRIRLESTVDICGRSYGDFDITAPATPAAKQWAGWGSALKPAHEPVVLARKPLDAGCTIAENVLRWSTGALNIDQCRISTSDNLNGGAYANTGIERNDGWGMQRAGAGEYKQPVGRFPSNLIHDASPAVLQLFPSSSITGKRTAQSKSAKVQGTTWLTDNHESQEYTDSGSAARFFKACEFTPADYAPIVYYAKASKSDRGEGNTHATVKPTSLIQYLARLSCPPGGTILDPFGGSGTLAVAAINEGFHYILIEKEPEYCEIARKRIAAVPARLDRWAEAEG